MTKIEIKGLEKHYPRNGSSLHVLSGINLKVDNGEFVALFGPNGCGKTTMLRIIAGMEPFEKGDILIGGKRPTESRIGFVFQNYSDSLFPWLSCRDNIMFPYMLKSGIGRAEMAEQELDSLLSSLKIYLPQESFPYQLSGGQQQMASILRTIIYKPDVILMDEPFSSLAHEIRLFMQEVLLRAWHREKPTILFVSHDIEEALLLANRVVFLGGQPARILNVIEVPFNHPRDRSLLKSRKFFDIRKRCLKIMEGGK